ncbi:TPA: class I SAM-dependent methyltransferase [Candidatus Bathyarchaeota archaeon]|nr:class I SAM-dependent methyltransferase [Candidatus Bathyarchaeota archaeon]
MSKKVPPGFFDQIAHIYDEVRPGYPEEMIKDIISISGIPDGGRILEIGCGTGQATIPFAKRGYYMICLDISKEMAFLTAKKCRKYPKVHVYPISFEEWELEPNSFDLVISGTAFHWIPKEVAYPKAALALKDSGYLAVFWNFHPTPYTGFFKEVQKVYRGFVPEWRDPEKERSIEDKIKSIENEINETGLFEKAIVKRYPWTKEYTADQYIKLLNTYSDHRLLGAERRRRLFTAIKTLIEKEYRGKIIRPYLTVLFVARRLSKKPS